MWPNPHYPADFVTFAKEILNGKLHFLCIEKVKKPYFKIFNVRIKIIIFRAYSFQMVVWLNITTSRNLIFSLDFL